jgi:hypothetical protein
MVRMENIRLPRKILFGGLAKAGVRGHKEVEVEGGYAIQVEYL